MDLKDIMHIYYKIIYVFLTIFLYLLKCPQSLILSALRAFLFSADTSKQLRFITFSHGQSW